MTTKLRWTVGTTINTGNFGNVRFDFTVEDDKRENESIVEASERIYDFVEGQLQAKIDEAKAEL